ncbi:MULTISPECIES: thiamine pyrophosphate-binding protein [Bradyrhizobium]|jgi:acetolactate synthase-1/2/3 large subunit|uniref:Thiamine pyrophosphate-binding protein n=8 Tax=Bradyrhizobium TaxID=374 RepID=A0ABS5GJ60_9BRAD|nr:MULTISPECIES: thiamine pyrophosphate-binding protein [Bradyrhizobium]RTL93681.1 MAG: thiamine pyrophosphate-binding protein [Bradyrhizobiaceae bacterium]ABQ34218.1 Putative acetolactate synthase (Acetohydroxy-acid synthase) (ALS), TPP-requiring enzyme [Bradyrhizobium sp. BTAi1]MBR1141069.1 thiamine pyrophosphate-binding protein [Bradyrhizobium denitrificans]MCL8489003.1 thiamine pyrophosphate-binding protein [Bradyrhizobium denitrificans]MDU1494892.1 thiamine pyrophosphate-binding protein [
MKISPDSAAALIARLLKRRGVSRVFALCGGHIMPIWMRLDAEGIRIIDVRDERAAVHMAQAHAELTGELGVALVTAGPGMTNAITGIANAHVSRAPVLVISGGNPRPQENRGGLQDMDHTQLVRSITRYARTVREPSLVLQELDEAISRAFGDGGEPGPVFIDFPVDTLRGIVPEALQLEEHLAPKPRAAPRPDPAEVEKAVELLWSARRVLVISGRGARGAGPELIGLLDRLGAVYLDTGESRGLVPDDHPSVVGAMRGAVMGDADVVLTVGRKLDFQLAYGSPAVFKDAKFVRISDSASELRDNRRGAAEILASPAETLRAMVALAGNRESAVDRQWAAKLRAGHQERAAKLKQSMAAAPAGSDGRLHPNRVLSALQDAIGNDAVVITDGGDFLSFARVGLSAPLMLDPGPFGCIGIGVPYGIAASLAFPDRPVVVATGDGAFGFNAIEVDTAVRHKAPVLIVVANNGAWQIEVHDQTVTHGKVVGTKLQFADHAAMARAFGMHAERVETAEQLGPAIKRALANRPALLDMVVTPEAVSSDAKTGLAWVPDLQPLAAWDEAERKWRGT